MKNWEDQNNSLYQKFKFKNFIEAWAFMNKVALLAEKANHHPEWKNVYNTVEIWLTTHDEGNTITAKDRELAEKITEALA
ncbi:MAG: 4a-hydroxytetrahydrobiopterin dehydratase [Vicingaceae bacterium]|jgi:4a-hydroxytetrahydrobiopterin dehydratase